MKIDERECDRLYCDGIDRIYDVWGRDRLSEAERERAARMRRAGDCEELAAWAIDGERENGKVPR